MKAGLVGIVAEWSRALVQSHLEWTVPSLNPGEICYGYDELSERPIVAFTCSKTYHSPP